jgi:hypothetical protein
MNEEPSQERMIHVTLNTLKQIMCKGMYKEFTNISCKSMRLGYVEYKDTLICKRGIL